MDIFALNLAPAKIKTRKYILYMSPSMEQKSKIAKKETSENVHAEITTFKVHNGQVLTGD